MPTVNDIPADSAAKLITELTRAATEPSQIDIDSTGLGAGLPSQIPLLWNATAQKPISVREYIDEWRQWPARREGVATTDTLRSFCELVNRHKDGGSAIFARASWPSPSLTAVIDYHHDRSGGPGSDQPDARWGRHRIVYQFPLTDEFTAWVSNDAGVRKPPAFAQLEFAEFLEEHAAELAVPTDGERSAFEPLFKERFAVPTELIDLSRNLEVFVGSKIKRQERLSSGERVIEFNTENRDLAGRQIDIPGLFMIAVPAFVDGPPVRIPARLRYRPVSGDVVWFYQLYRWEHWLRTQVQSDLAHAGAETGLPTFEGTAEKIG